MGDSFGRLFRVTTWGESHGGGVGVVVDGCPAGLALNETDIQHALDKRRPGQNHLTTQRKEDDKVEMLSGVFEGMTQGTAIAMLVRNQDARSSAYEDFKQVYRPSHADFTYQQKYGRRNWQGGGRASARETIGRVAAGAIAGKLLYEQQQIEVLTYVRQIHDMVANIDESTLSNEAIEASLVRCPDPEASALMAERIAQIRKAGDSIGGIIEARVRGCPAGLGEPVFDKLTADLSKAIMSLPATRGIEFGEGFSSVALTGSQHNDRFEWRDDRIRTVTNHSGGIQGGISNGEEIVLRVAFKPTATIATPQQTVDTEGNVVTLVGKGRHDPCVLPRAVPMVSAMIHLVLVDHWLRTGVQQLTKHQ